MGWAVASAPGECDNNRELTQGSGGFERFQRSRERALHSFGKAEAGAQRA